MLVEILGPSAVGKSTALNKICENYKSIIGPTDMLSSISKDDYRFYLDFFDFGMFINGCINIISTSNMKPSQKVSALSMLNTTARKYFDYTLSSDKSSFYLQDEFFLHRSFSLLCFSENLKEVSSWYFKTVPIPDVAIFFNASSNSILERHKFRAVSINSYMYKDDDQIAAFIERSEIMYEVAKDVLYTRGVLIYELDANCSSRKAVSKLENIVKEVGNIHE